MTKYISDKRCWSCANCDTENDMSAEYCYMCMQKKQIVVQWKCRNCLNMNFDSAAFCSTCGTPRNAVRAYNHVPESPPRGAYSPAGWKCPNCAAINYHADNYCERCGHRKDYDINQWRCEQCDTINSGSVSICRKCGHSKPESSTNKLIPLLIGITILAVIIIVIILNNPNY